MVSKVQFDKIQGLIEAGIDEGATAGRRRPRPAGRTQPRLLCPADRVRQCRPRHAHRPRGNLRAGAVDHALRRDEDEAIEIANDTVYGLAAYIQSKDIDRARKVAARMRAGTVHINYPGLDLAAPFGGYKQSGNGREYGEWGLDEFLEMKGVVGYGAAA